MGSVAEVVMANRCQGIVVGGETHVGGILHRCGNAAKIADTWCERCGTPEGQLRQAYLRNVLRPAVVAAIEDGEGLDTFGNPPRRKVGRPRNVYAHVPRVERFADNVVSLPAPAAEAPVETAEVAPPPPPPASVAPINPFADRSPWNPRRVRLPPTVG